MGDRRRVLQVVAPSNSQGREIAAALRGAGLPVLDLAEVRARLASEKPFLEWTAGAVRAALGPGPPVVVVDTAWPLAYRERWQLLAPPPDTFAVSPSSPAEIGAVYRADLLLTLERIEAAAPALDALLARDASPDEISLTGWWRFGVSMGVTTLLHDFKEGVGEALAAPAGRGGVGDGAQALAWARRRLGGGGGAAPELGGGDGGAESGGAESGEEDEGGDEDGAESGEEDEGGEGGGEGEGAPPPPAGRDARPLVVRLGGAPTAGKSWAGRELQRRCPGAMVYDADHLRLAGLFRCDQRTAFTGWRALDEHLKEERDRIYQGLFAAARGRPIIVAGGRGFAGAAPGAQMVGVRIELPSQNEGSAELMYRRMVRRQLDRIVRNIRMLREVVAQAPVQIACDIIDRCVWLPYRGDPCIPPKVFAAKVKKLEGMSRDARAGGEAVLTLPQGKAMEQVVRLVALHSGRVDRAGRSEGQGEGRGEGRGEGQGEGRGEGQGEGRGEGRGKGRSEGGAPPPAGALAQRALAAVDALVANREWIRRRIQDAPTEEEFGREFAARLGGALTPKLLPSVLARGGGEPGEPGAPVERVVRPRPGPVLWLAGQPGVGKTWLGREIARRRPDAAVFDLDDLRSCAAHRLAAPGRPVPHWREANAAAAAAVREAVAAAGAAPVVLVGVGVEVRLEEAAAERLHRAVLWFGPPSAEANRRLRLAYRRAMLRELEKVVRNAEALRATIRATPPAALYDAIGMFFHLAQAVGQPFAEFRAEFERSVAKVVAAGGQAVTAEAVLAGLDSLLGPPPVEEAVAPPPVEKAVAPPPVEEAVAPPPAEEAVAPPPAEEAVAPPPAEEAVAPPPVEEAAAASAGAAGGGRGRGPGRGPAAAPRDGAPGTGARYREYKRARPRARRGPLPPGAPLVAGRVAVIVPFRDNPAQNRAAQLAQFLAFWDGVNAGRRFPGADVFVVEQSPGARFNRGLLLNVGFLVAREAPDAPPGGYESFVFSDVDTLPDAAALRNFFVRPARPVHLSSDRVFDRHLYPEYLGGVVAFSREDFERVGGFPNSFFGWGAEDDALYDRVAGRGLAIWDAAEGRMESMPHEDSRLDPAAVNPRRWEAVLGAFAADRADAAAGRPARDGLAAAPAALAAPRRVEGAPPLVRVLADPSPPAPGSAAGTNIPAGDTRTPPEPPDGPRER